MPYQMGGQFQIPEAAWDVLWCDPVRTWVLQKGEVGKTLKPAVISWEITIMKIYSILVCFGFALRLLQQRIRCEPQKKQILNLGRLHHTDKHLGFVLFCFAFAFRSKGFSLFGFLVIMVIGGGAPLVARFDYFPSLGNTNKLREWDQGLKIC